MRQVVKFDQISIGENAGKENVIFSAPTEAATKRCSYEKVFWKCAANLQENTHAELKSRFGMAVLL